MLLGWLGPGSWGATAPRACVPLLATRVGPGFPQLTAVSQPHQPVLPVFVGAQSAGMCDRGDKGGGQHPCRLSQKPHGGLWGFPSVVSPLPRELLARGSAVAAGRSCLGPWWFGLAAAGPRVTQRH